MKVYTATMRTSNGEILKITLESESDDSVIEDIAEGIKKIDWRKDGYELIQLERLK